MDRFYSIKCSRKSLLVQMCGTALFVAIGTQDQRSYAKLRFIVSWQGLIALSGSAFKESWKTEHYCKIDLDVLCKV